MDWRVLGFKLRFFAESAKINFFEGVNHQSRFLITAKERASHILSMCKV